MVPPELPPVEPPEPVLPPEPVGALAPPVPLVSRPPPLLGEAPAPPPPLEEGVLELVLPPEPDTLDWPEEHAIDRIPNAVIVAVAE